MQPHAVPPSHSAASAAAVVSKLLLFANLATMQPRAVLPSHSLTHNAPASSSEHTTWISLLNKSMQPRAVPPSQS
jgi:hypothetical protein